MRALYSSALVALLMATAGQAQVTFTNATSELSGTTASGGCVGVCDMNGDGLDDIATLDNSRDLVVHYQNADGTYSRVDYGAVSGASQWGMSLGDVDNDGHKDLISGGSYDGVHYMNIDGPGAAVLGSLNNGSMFTQCVNMADIDNEGSADYFACHDDAAPRIWLNDGNGSLAFDGGVMDFTSNPVSDMSGNYGSTWTDFDNDGDIDLYISKCRQGVSDPNDPRRWNRLFVNDGNGNYTELTDQYGLTNHNQSWSSDFADIDNDGDFDLVTTNHDATIQLFENDGTGHFSEITAGSGLEVTGFLLQSIMRDFDNDGFMDLLIAGGSAYLFMNDGDNTFTATPLPSAPKTLHSFGLGDLNSDGFIDIFASYGDGYVTADPNTPDRLWLNDGNANHWFAVNLEGTVSNRDAIGARTEIFGPWGVQVREVRAGESYGIVNSFTAHFGLGAATTVDSVRITWPSGNVDVYDDLDADQSITVIENTCIAPVATIAASGDPVVCTGGAPLTLTADPGWNYGWNTGETTQSIDVTAGGSYTVTIDDGSGCTGLASIFVEQDPDETPTVSLDNDAAFCEGGSVTLTSSPASDYTWSTGETTQSITVDQSGTFSVSVTGVCGASTSDDVVIDVYPTVMPVASNVVLPAPGSATLTATGDSIVWYDVALGGSPVGYGSPWNSPVVTSPTSFWCSNVASYGGGTSYGGAVDNTVDGQYHGNGNNWQVFTANEPFTIRSVKVYANGAGAREIGLVDMDNGTTVVQGSFTVPNGESRVQLDFDVPADGEYGLRIMSGNPQLWRDGLGSNPAYPFALGTLGEITGTTVSGGNSTEYYYFFYDWEVEATSVNCESDRLEVLVDINVGVEELAGHGLSIWPNPADDLLNITFDGGELDVRLFDLTGREVLVRTADAHAMGQGQMTLNVSALTPGKYILRALTTDGVRTARVVVR